VALLRVRERDAREQPSRLGRVVVLDGRLEMLPERKRLGELAAEPAEQADGRGLGHDPADRLGAGRTGSPADNARRVKLFSQDTKADALAHSPLFAGLSRKDLVALAKVTEDMEVPAGRALCRDGELGHEFFVIVEGEVDIAKDERHIRMLCPRRVLRRDRPHRERAAHGDRHDDDAAPVLRTHASELLGLLHQQPEIERKIMLELAKRVLDA
jgi:hypothetical protein